MTVIWDTGIFTTIACRWCGHEQDVRGPSAMPTRTEPGWQIDVAGFYQPNGHHYCAAHATDTWVVWCSDVDDMIDNSSDLLVRSPGGLTTDELLDLLGSRTCRDGHMLIGAERCANYVVNVDIELGAM